jgi:hypothetical protein
MFKAAILIAVISASSTCLGQRDIDLGQNLYAFTGEPNARQEVDDGLLLDFDNNKIANACLNGASRSELARLNIPDLDSRLQKMQTGNLLSTEQGLYVLTIPVLAGKNRLKLSHQVSGAAKHMAPRVAIMLDQIRAATPGDEEMAFHLLWSRAMDRMWYRTWQREGRPGKGPPFARWIIFPPHPLTVGTVSYDGVIGGGSNAKSWSHQSICGSFHPSEFQSEILKGAWGQRVSVANLKVLQSVGIFDEAGTFTGFAYHRGDSLDKLLDQLTDEYAAIVANAYNYVRLSKAYRIPVTELWLAIQHETAYAILAELASSGKLVVPEPLKGKGDTRFCRSVISVRLENPPN